MKESIRKIFSDKRVRLAALLTAAFLLLILVYFVFFKKSTEKTNAYEPTELETRLSRMLSQIEGVNDATVMIGQEDGRAVSAVIVFKGADSILTRMRVVEAASGALNLEKENILVYPASS